MKFPNPFKKEGNSEGEEDEHFDEEEELEESSNEEDDDDNVDNNNENDDELDIEDGPSTISKFIVKLKNNPNILIFGSTSAGILIVGSFAVLLLLDGNDESATTSSEGKTSTSISMDLDVVTKGGAKILTPPVSGKKLPTLATKQASKDNRFISLIPPSQKPESTLTSPQTTVNAAAKQSTSPVTRPKSGVTGVQVVSVAETSFSQVPEVKTDKPLSIAPDAALIEQAAQGQVPKISTDGRHSFSVYARPFNLKDSRPRISLIVTGLGLSRTATSAAVRRLPGAVTLAFDSYGVNLNKWAAAARENGHEMLVLLPMESTSFPVRDPGPNAVVSSVEQKENLRRLELVLSSMPGYVGILNSMGSQFIKDGTRLKPILEVIKARGLMFVDSGLVRKSLAPKIATQIGLPHAISNIVIDRNPSKLAINRQLARLENIAQKQSISIGILHPYPVSLETVIAWIKTLEQKKLVLGPISSVAKIKFVK